MGRKERKQRRWEREQEAEEQAYLQHLAEEAGITLDEQPETDVDMESEQIEWDGFDQPGPRLEAKEAEAWRKAAASLGTVADVAKLFRVHFKTVERWRKRDGLPCIRVGGVIRYPLGDILRWASARRVGA